MQELPRACVEFPTEVRVCRLTPGAWGPEPIGKNLDKGKVAAFENGDTRPVAVKESCFFRLPKKSL
jgi:hypothetical protein